MPTVFELIKMNEKEMREFLENHRIEYKRKRNTFLFRYPLEDVLFDLEIHFRKGNVCWISAKSAENISDGKSVAIQCKQACVREGFVPFHDDTNHEYERYYVSLSKEGEGADIYVRKREDQFWEAGLSIAKPTDEQLKRSAPFEWILYLSGGFLFGLLMFASMGDYSWTAFGICMLGGLFWGVSFGIVFSLVTRIPSSTGKGKEDKDDRKYQTLYEKMQPVNGEKFYRGTLWISEAGLGHSRAFRAYSAYLVPTEDAFDVFYLRKKTLQKRQLSFRGVDDALPYGHLSVTENGEYRFFEFADKAEFAEMKELVDEKLGHHSEEYVGIFRTVQEIINEYSPASLRELRRDEFTTEAEIIAGKLYQNPNIQREELVKVITRAFDYDPLYSRDIADLILKKFRGENA